MYVLKYQSGRSEIIKKKVKQKLKVQINKQTSKISLRYINVVQKEINHQKVVVKIIIIKLIYFRLPILNFNNSLVKHLFSVDFFTYIFFDILLSYNYHLNKIKMN